MLCSGRGFFMAGISCNQKLTSHVLLSASSFLLFFLLPLFSMLLRPRVL